MSKDFRIFRKMPWLCTRPVTLLGRSSMYEISSFPFFLTVQVHLTLIGMRQPSCLFWIIFWQLSFSKNSQTVLEVKIDIDCINLTPCQAHWVLENMPLGGAKDEHFSCFHSSCQLGLTVWESFMAIKKLTYFSSK
jgi:hypothetical protein